MFIPYINERDGMGRLIEGGNRLFGARVYSNGSKPQKNPLHSDLRRVAKSHLSTSKDNKLNYKRNILSGKKQKTIETHEGVTEESALMEKRIDPTKEGIMGVKQGQRKISKLIIIILMKAERPVYQTMINLHFLTSTKLTKLILAFIADCQ